MKQKPHLISRPPLATLLTASILLTTPLSAELKNCNGVWTNKPCAEKTIQTMSETPYREPSPEEQSLMDRKKLLYALETSATTLRSRGGVVDISVVRQLCLAPTTTVEECKSAVLQKEQDINSALVTASSQPAPSGPSPVGTGTGETNVTVIDNSDDGWYGSGRRCSGHRHFRPSKRPGDIPNLIPPTPDLGPGFRGSGNRTHGHSGHGHTGGGPNVGPTSGLSATPGPTQGSSSRPSGGAIHSRFGGGRR